MCRCFLGLLLLTSVAESWSPFAVSDHQKKALGSLEF
jgi:hypothetical protein